MRLVAVALSCVLASAAFAADKPVVAPIFEVDPFWPKPLPNHWLTGSTIGVSIDANDNVWTLHRAPSIPQVLTDPVATCCKAAPEVLVYDQAGNLVLSWDGKGAGYEWPESNHGLTVDHKGNVWIGGNGMKDSHILKFTREGKFLLQVGKQGMRGGSNDPANFWRPSKIVPDAGANEMYVSDGYGNRRIVVIDADSGMYKRHWGAYGAKPDDAAPPPYKEGGPPAKQFSTVHCVAISNDGLVYVCDRVNNRIQVFRKDGAFVREAIIDPKTYGQGTVWDIAFSHDPRQAYLYVANGVDQKINVVSRETLEVLTSFGDGGRQPGQFFGVHNLVTDSKGNLYATDTYTGARVQRFLFKGVGPVTKRDQGAPWPQAARQ